MFRINLLFALLTILIAAEEKDLAFDIMTNENRMLLLEYTSVFEIIEEIVSHACRIFSDLCPSTDEDLILLKREIVHFASAGVAIQDKVMQGFRFKKFKLVSEKIKQLRLIGKREFEKLDEDLKNSYANEDKYLEFFVFIKPIHKLLEKKIASYEKRGLSKDQIQEEIKTRMHELMDLWHEDDPEGINYEIYQMKKKLRNQKTDL